MPTCSSTSPSTGGKGIRKGELVRLTVCDNAKPLYVALRDAVLRAGAVYLPNYMPSDVKRSEFETASLEQLSTFPARYWKGLADVMDHEIVVWSDDPHELDGIDPAKLVAPRRALGPYYRWLERKEAQGKHTWTIALYGTKQMAKAAGLTLEQYWQQIINACFLDHEDSVRCWRESFREIERLKRKLDRLELVKLRVEAEGTDLTVGVGPARRWMGGGGYNIPSFEVYVSPDARLTEGVASLSEPLFYYGTIIDGIKVRFENGTVVEAEAKKNQSVLDEMLAVDKGASRLGEFSLTDSRLSRITHFMADTLFDENRGGEQGNFHIAFGNAYKDCYPGDASTLKKSDWNKLGYNESDIHVDVISTTQRVVTGWLPSGRSKVIYADGKFCI